ncbi:MAG: NADPH-dependent reductase [Chloroflexi bacterium]|jgi:FMN reductase|nr:NADPH-dependent reductase [Chloroflexota bacterium]
MNLANIEVKILGLGGSMRQPSHTLTVLNMALDAAGQSGAVTELIDLRELKLPLYFDTRRLEDFPDPEYIRQYLDKFKEADGFIFCAPTYHGTPSASFKNALDFLEFLPRRPNLYLTGKVGGLLAVASGTTGGPTCLTSLIYNARALRLLVAPGSTHVSPTKRVFDQAGQLTDEKLALQVAELGAEVTRLARLLKAERAL